MEEPKLQAVEPGCARVKAEYIIVGAMGSKQQGNVEEQQQMENVC